MGGGGVSGNKAEPPCPLGAGGDHSTDATIPPPHHGVIHRFIHMSFAPGGDWQSVSGAQQSWGGGGYGGVGFWQSLVYPESQYDYSQLWGYGRQYAVDAAIAAGVAALMQRGGANEIPPVLSGPVGPVGSGIRPEVPVTTPPDFRDWEQGLETPLPEWVYETIPDAPGTIDTSSPGWGVAQEDPAMAIDWTSVINTAITGYQQPAPSGFAGGGASGTWAQPNVPAQVTVDTRTGQVKPCRRRRRRRLLTPTDLSDLAALAAVVGKGDALKLAVAKAVRR